MIETEEVALVWNFDFDFFGLLARVGACEAGAGFVDCVGGYVVVPAFAAGVAAGLDACG